MYNMYLSVYLWHYTLFFIHNSKFTTKNMQAFDRLLIIMDELREKCPWDRKQTFQSLRHLSIEEIYELSDAILDEDVPEIKKELGDILLHVVFYAKIASESTEKATNFNIEDVLNTLCDKLISRHPHIYGDMVATTEEDVNKLWAQVKQKESNNEKSALAGVPKSLPALVKAIRIQEKARNVGFDWEDKTQVWEKVKEEMGEFEEEFRAGANFDHQKAEAEFGDLLFSLVNYARFININPETALEKTNKKFTKRFQYLEEKAKENNQILTEMTLEQMDVYWNEAKKL